MKTKEIVLLPEEAFNEEIFQSVLYQKLGLKPDGDFHVKPLKRSIDARGRKVVVRILCEIVASQEKKSLISYSKQYADVSKSKQVVIVGSGPAGLFAALRLIEHGIKPILIERG